MALSVERLASDDGYSTVHVSLDGGLDRCMTCACDAEIG